MKFVATIHFEPVEGENSSSWEDVLGELLKGAIRVTDIHVEEVRDMIGCEHRPILNTITHQGRGTFGLVTATCEFCGKSIKRHYAKEWEENE